MPVAFSQYRDDETSDSNSSEKSSDSKEAPHGPESPEKQSAAQADEKVDALSSRFGKHLYGVPPVSPLLSATATEEPSSGGISPGPGGPGHLARGGLSVFPSLPAFHGILGRIPVPKLPEEQTAAAPHSSALSFEASADAFKREFSSTHFAQPTSCADSAQLPVAPSGGPGSTAPEKAPPFWFKSPPAFQRHEVLYDGKNPFLFSGQTQKYLDSVKWQGFKGQKPLLFSAMNKPVSSAENESLPNGSNIQARTLPNGQPTPLHDGQGHASAELNVQASAKLESPVAVHSPNMASQETRTGSAKRQSKQLEKNEDTVNDKATSTKRLFHQSRLTNPPIPKMPYGYVLEIPTVIPPVKPTITSKEDFILFARKTISLSTLDMPVLTSLYGLVISFTRYVATKARNSESINMLIANAMQELDALKKRTQLPDPDLYSDAVLEIGTRQAELEEMIAKARTALQRNESSLRYMEGGFLEQIICSIQSVADQTCIPKALIEDSKRKAENINTCMNELRLEILALEDKLQKDGVKSRHCREWRGEFSERGGRPSGERASHQSR